MPNLNGLFFQEFDKKGGLHIQTPSHAFTSSIHKPNQGDESERAKVKFDNMWKQKYQIAFGQTHKDAIPPRVDANDTAHLSTDNNWWRGQAHRPSGSNPSSTRSLPGHPSQIATMDRLGQSQPVFHQDPAISLFVEHSIRGACPTQPSNPRSQLLEARPSTGPPPCGSDDTALQGFASTMNRSYGLGLSCESPPPRRSHSLSKLTSGKPLVPPTSNSSYGHFTQLKVHKTSKRVRPTCNETRFVDNLVKVGIPYNPEIRFAGHVHTD